MVDLLLSASSPSSSSSAPDPSDERERLTTDLVSSLLLPDPSSSAGPSSDLEEQNQQRLPFADPVAPICPTCCRVHAFTGVREGPYATGWVCDLCRNRGSEFRWCCRGCEHDICTTCVPPPSSPSSSPSTQASSSSSSSTPTSSSVLSVLPALLPTGGLSSSAAAVIENSSSPRCSSCRRWLFVAWPGEEESAMQTTCSRCQGRLGAAHWACAGCSHAMCFSCQHQPSLRSLLSLPDAIQDYFLCHWLETTSLRQFFCSFLSLELATTFAHSLPIARTEWKVRHGFRTLLKHPALPAASAPALSSRIAHREAIMAPHRLLPDSSLVYALRIFHPPLPCCDGFRSHPCPHSPPGFTADDDTKPMLLWSAGRHHVCLDCMAKHTSALFADPQALNLVPNYDAQPLDLLVDAFVFLHQLGRDHRHHQDKSAIPTISIPPFSSSPSSS